MKKLVVKEKLKEILECLESLKKIKDTKGLFHIEQIPEIERFTHSLLENFDLELFREFRDLRYKSVTSTPEGSIYDWSIWLKGVPVKGKSQSLDDLFVDLEDLVFEEGEGLE